MGQALRVRREQTGIPPRAEWAVQAAPVARHVLETMTTLIELGDDADDDDGDDADDDDDDGFDGRGTVSGNCCGEW